MKKPVSAAQLAVWVSQQLDPASTLYHCGGYLAIDGTLQRPLLERALRRAIGETEALRVRFTEEDGQLWQIVDPVTDPRVSYVDAEDDEAAKEWMRADLEEPMDLHHGPLFAHAVITVGQRSLLFLRYHHIAIDGVGQQLYTNRIAEIYTALVNGTEPPKCRFGTLEDLVAEDAAYRESADFETDRDHWHAELADLPIPVSVAGRIGNAVPSSFHRTVSLPGDHVTTLLALAREKRTLWSAVMIAAAVAYLHRMTGERDVVVGLSLPARRGPAARTTPGMLAKELPLRVAIPPDTTFAGLIDQVSKKIELILRHQLYPMEVLHRELGMAGGRGDLFGTIVNVMLFERQTKFGDLPATRHIVQSGPVKDLVLNAYGSVHGRDGILLEFDAHPALYDTDTLALQQERFIEFTGALSGDPHRPLGEADILPAEERHRLLVEWNDTDHEVPADTIPELITAQAERTPDNPAVSDETTTLTYAELEVRANRLAHHLIAKGVRPDQVVALRLPRNVDMVVASLAALKTGATYLPIDLDHPAERIAFMLAETKPVLTLGEIPDLRTYPDTGPDVEIHPATAAYVIYTSGSTGRPKGTVIDHAALTNYIAWACAVYPSTSGVALLHSSPAFDLSVTALYAPLISGGRVHIGPLEGEHTEKPTYLKITPSHLAVLNVLPGDFSPSAELVTGGEPLYGDLLDQWRQRNPGVRVVNEYGPTETTVGCTDYPIEPGQAVPAGVLTFGKPNWNTRMYVLDPALRPAPIGVGGEVYIAGPQLARGYFNRPGLTAERFVANPYSPGRMYRTGDLARWRADGNLEFLGRVDHQVKLHGYRIELGEIESVLLEHPNVGQAAVVLREDRPGDKRLVAYLVGDAEGVRDHAAKSLPDYMVPSAFVVLDALPLTGNRKLDRAALPEPEYATTESRGPRTAVEEILCGLFAEVLGVETVGVDDDFFDLGGHSLLATRLVNRIRSGLGVEFGVRDVFDSPTVAGLAAKTAGEARKPLEPRPRPEAVPLSFAQQRLWFLHRLKRAAATYNIPAALRITGPLDRKALRHAVADVVARHESLRTIFPETATGPHQVVLDQIDVPWIATKPDDVTKALSESVRHGFDLGVEPPLRVYLFEESVNEHVLLLLLHHIAGDGWSMRPLSRDVLSAYDARGRGEVPVWTPLPVQYADYALWQREQPLDDQVEYWTEQLKDLPDQVTLPMDRPRPAEMSYRGDILFTAITPELHQRLTDLARAHGVTLFMVLHAALAALLTRMGAGTDIPIGSPIAGRTDQALDDLVGFFVNTLVLRTDTSGDPSFAELLNRVRETDLAAYAHQDVPFEQLVEVLNPARSMAHTPLFQVMLQLQNTAREELTQSGLDIRPHPIGTGTTKFDLTVQLWENASGIDAMIEYATDVFDRTTIEAATARWIRLLEAAVENAGRRIGDVDLTERDLLDSWNATGRDVVQTPLPELLNKRAQDDHIAVECDGAALTYRELHERANQVAHHLRAQGIGPDAKVGLRMGRSVEMIVGLLGILKAGAAYVPLDPTHPADRIRYIRDDSGITIEVTEGTFRDLDRHPCTPVDSGVTPDNLAYVVYTSGSTGRPKGIAMSGRCVVNMLAWQREAVPGGPGARTAQFTALTFDVHVQEVISALLDGETLVVATDDVRRDPVAFTRWLADRRITRLFVPNVMIRAICDQAKRLDTDLSAPLKTLRHICQAGEPLLLDEDVRALLRGYPDLRIHNHYGSTEVQVVTAHTVDAADDYRVAPIGAPTWNNQMYVLDANLRPVPVGVPGELYTAGPGLARGYEGRPALTAERFVAGPSGRRMYRMGDLGRWRTDGTLEYLGRADDQVKIRGFRVEPAEVDSVLAGHPDVAHSVVLVREHNGEKRLVAYVVGDVEADALKAHLTRELPEYMVPSAFVVLDELPLTPNGKIDRRALPEPEYTATTSRAPRTPVEEVLCGLFAEVLGVPAGVDDSFFDLGGHSLLATRVVNRVRTVLGAELEVRDLFESPTVAGLATRVHEGRVRKAIRPVTRPERVPLSYAQQRLWFLHRLEGRTATYNIAGAVRIPEVNAEALRAALADVAARHESLRTIFPEGPDGPYQLVLDDAAPELVVGPREGAARYAFDLEREIPIRAWLDGDVLLLVLHHIAGDGWSIQPLSQDLLTAYEARCRDEAPAWAPLPVQYADYALWQRELGRELLLDEQVEYWSRQLEDLPEQVTFPADRPRPPLPSYRGDVIPFTFDPAPLTALARAHGVSLFMVLQAGLAALLTRLGAGTDVPIGSPIAGRTDDVLDDLVGFFVNTLVLRTDTSGNPAFAELLDRVRETDLAAFAHQDVPFEHLVELLNPARSMAHNPLFQVELAVQNTPADDLEIEPVATGATKFDLSVNVRPDGTGVVEYATDLFDRGTAEEILARWLRLLTAFAADPTRPIGEAPILTPDEEDQILRDWNDTGGEVPGATVPDLIAAQAARTPYDIALVSGDVELSYVELLERADGFAGHLIDRGVRPGDLVAVVLSRGIDLVVALLGVLRAGAAYLPIDPGFPAERIALMLADAEPALVIDALGPLNAEPRRRNKGAQCGEGAAYVIYTSGSTGVPKGVVVPHRALTNFLAAMAEWFPLTHEDRLLAVTTVGFDIAGLELFLPLLRGATVVLADRDTITDPAALAELVENATIMQATPTLWHTLVREHPESLRGRTILVGGEALPPALARELAGLGRAVNLYGPTETTIWSTAKELSDRPLIGKPLLNQQVYVLDAGLRPVPPGVAGELYIAGDGLAHGYLNRPALTAERFVANPYGPGRMYRTGDLARWTRDGELDYAGRADTQIKLRGFRIEPGEIEQTLLTHDAVSRAAVVLREDRLVGYLVPEDGVEIDTVTLRKHVANVLPEYMVPAALVVLDELPLTQNGKVDRRALPEPEYAAAATRDARTPVEEILCGLFADVLGVPAGVEDGFFDLGGHSLLATRLTNRIRKALNIDLPVRAVFEAPTVAGLAERLAGGAEARPVRPVERPERVPLSYAQQRLWFLRQLSGPNAIYNIPAAVRLTGELDRDALRAAIGDVVARHETLRTIFRQDDGDPYQVVTAPEPPFFEVETMDLAGALTEAARHPFDLSNESPLRATLFTVGPEPDGASAGERTSAREHVLLLLLHHIAADGWSMGPLSRDLATAYRARCAGAAPTWEPLPVQYADYVLWQREQPLDLDYWKDQLAGLPEQIALPADRARGPVQSYRGDVIDLTVPPALHDALKDVARQHGVSLFMVLQAGLAAFLTKLGAGTDVPIGSPIAGRTDDALDDLVGFFVNTLVLRNDTSGDPAFAELLDRVRETDLAAYAHQDVPFEHLVEVLNPARSMAHHPLFQVALALQNTPLDRFTLPGLTTRFEPANTGTARFDLAIQLNEVDGLGGVIEYATDLFDRTTVERFADLWLRALETLAADPSKSISAVEVEQLGSTTTTSGESTKVVRSRRDTPETEILCALFADVLGHERVGPDDNFFDLGGHSLLATRLVNRVRATLNAELEVRTLFETQTPAALAGAITDARPARRALTPVERPEHVPLSYAQQRLWFLHRLEGPSATYNMPLAARLRGPVDVAALRAAVTDVVARHEVLRTRITNEGHQEVAEVDVPFDIVERNGWEEAARYRFDLSAELPIRVWLFRVAPEDHVLLLLVHHIAADGWSLGPLGRDLGIAYAARVRGAEPAWAPLPVQYADYALWQRELPLDLEYWRAQLADLPDQLTLPYDRPRPAVSSYRGAVHDFTLDVDLNPLARKHGVSLFMVLQAGLAALLTGLGAGTDIPIGSPIAGRTDQALDDLVGFFVNTLVLRTDTSGDPAFAELLDRVRETDLAAYAHQDVPFEHLVEVLNPVRSRAMHPLFQVMLALHNTAPAALELSGVDTTLERATTGTSRFDLAVHVYEDGRGAVEYSTDLFDAGTIETLLVRLNRLLTAAAASPDRPISEFDLLDAAERHELLVERNASDVPVEIRPLAELLTAQALRTPDLIAVECEGDRLTYTEFERRTNRFAHHLRKLGVGPDRTVGLRMPRGVDMIVGLVGVLKAGGAYVPVDPEHPEERIRYILDDAGVSLVVESVECEGPDTPLVGAAPDNLAYIVYTSGSTGRPKGIAMSGRCVVNMLAWQKEAVPGGPGTRTAQFTALTFDVHVQEVLSALLYGETLVIPTNEVRRDPAAFVRWLAANEINQLFVPNVMVRELCRVAAESDVDLSELRHISQAGEALALDRDLRSLLDRYPDLRIHNHYGSTEVQVVTAHTVSGTDEGVAPIGTPTWNNRAYVLDSRLRPVPPGVPGDLYVAGPGLARGYAGRPGLTAERFVANPFEPGRMYRMGDMATWRNGRLEYVGRADDQVKIRGARVEPAEVESALLADPSVAQAVVVVRDKRLVGYVVASASTTDTPVGSTCRRPDPQRLRARLAEVLPDFAVPSAIVVIDALPLTPNGKLDRRALPDPVFAQGGGRAPRSPEEEILCGLFAEVLGLPSVGVDDGFFDLGGHSLLAMRLVNRVRAVLGVELPVGTLFETPTVAGLVTRLDRSVRAGKRIERVERPERVPLSFAQRRLWFLHKLEGPSATYNMPLAVRLTGHLDPAKLRVALNDVVERHEVLRTRFVEIDGEPYQQVVETDVPFDIVERNGWEEAARYRFDLSAELPIRAWLFRVAPDEHVLLLLVHHIAADGWSLHPLARDVAAAYAGETLAPLPVQYADYALWQQDQPLDVEYWTRQLAGLPEELTLPYDRPRPPSASYRGATRDFAISKTLHSGLAGLARKHGVSLFMVLQAGLAALLTRLGASTDVPIGSPIAGRTDDALDDLVGFFVNTLVLRTDTSGSPTFAELLARVRETDLAAFAHQDVPFELLVERLNPARSQARHPLFQVVLVLEHAVAQPDFGELEASPVAVGTGTTKFDLGVHLGERGDGLAGVVEYATDLFDAATVDSMMTRFVRLLEAVVADPGRPVDRIDLLDPAERHELLHRWNTPVANTETGTIPDLFEAQAARTPDAVAVDDLTYAELNARANGLAHHLIAQGIGPEDIVAVSMPRSADLVVALLGVLKAGAAYLPVDPDYPAERISFLLDDSGATTVVREIPDGPGTNPVRRLRPEHPAYVIYTSGSTGTPKGVVIPHANVVRLFSATRRLFEFGEHDVWTFFHSFAFDFSVWEIWGALLHGGRLVVVPFAVSRSPEEFLRLLERECVTVLNQTPSAFYALPPADLALRTVIFGGEALDPRRLTPWFDRGIALVNMYGITETTVHVTHADLDRSHETSVIGRQIDDLRLYVLDTSLEPVPIGVAGELYVAGAGLARGYAGQPGLTASRFVADPFGPGRLYRTGDVVRRVASGDLEFVGRADDQVKIRGFRIEPGEVEAALLADPSVAQAVVVVRDERLVGYVVPVDGLLVDTVAARSRAGELLPAHAVPSAVVVLDAMPLTPNGKLDRRALPAPVFESSSRGPRTPQEEVLCGLFAEVLGLEHVGVDDSFFDLGGHSLLATRLVNRIRAVTGAEIGVRAIFDHPTVAALVPRLDGTTRRRPALRRMRPEEA